MLHGYSSGECCLFAAPVAGACLVKAEVSESGFLLRCLSILMLTIVIPGLKAGESASRAPKKASALLRLE